MVRLAVIRLGIIAYAVRLTLLRGVPQDISP